MLLHLFVRQRLHRDSPSSASAFLLTHAASDLQFGRGYRSLISV
jgi:hypothetical protein